MTDLNTINSLDRLISDAQLFQARLQTLSASQPLSFQDVLGLLSLYQQAIGQLQGLQINISPMPPLSCLANLIRLPRPAPICKPWRHSCKPSARNL
jgi:hypothetical protein